MLLSTETQPVPRPFMPRPPIVVTTRRRDSRNCQEIVRSLKAAGRYPSARIHQLARQAANAHIPTSGRYTFTEVAIPDGQVRNTRSLLAQMCLKGLQRSSFRAALLLAEMIPLDPKDHRPIVIVHRSKMVMEYSILQTKFPVLMTLLPREKTDRSSISARIAVRDARQERRWPDCRFIAMVKCREKY